jgi:hypothetical protein
VLLLLPVLLSLLQLANAPAHATGAAVAKLLVSMPATAPPAMPWKGLQPPAAAPGTGGTARPAKLACVMSNVALLINGSDNLADLQAAKATARHLVLSAGVAHHLKRAVQHIT